MVNMLLQYMSEDDREDVEYAIKRGIHIPAYHFKGTTHDGQVIEMERQFSPVQMRQTTDAAYPECLTESNCTKLVAAWNQAGRGRFHYEYLG